eukprot:1195415-Prorocentrum_minimum.AAC.6
MYLEDDKVTYWHCSSYSHREDVCFVVHLPSCPLQRSSVSRAWLTYSQLKDEVCKVANWLRSKGVKKGDRVILYAPMVMELPIGMLACARIGAIHSVVFGGFSAEALAARIQGSESSKCPVVTDNSAPK